MARLIDADELPLRSIDGTDLPKDKGLLVVLKEDIDNAPTVKLFCSYLSDGEVRQPCVESPCEHERPQGTWKRYMTGYQGDKVLNITFKCSECGRNIVYVPHPFDVDKNVNEFLSKYPFCHCGADMRGGEHEQE